MFVEGKISKGGGDKNAKYIPLSDEQLQEETAQDATRYPHPHLLHAHERDRPL